MTHTSTKDLVGKLKEESDDDITTVSEESEESSKAAEGGEASEPPKPAATAVQQLPPYSTMVAAALRESQEKKGVSLQGVCSRILKRYPDAAQRSNFRFQVRHAIAKGLESGAFKRASKTKEMHGIQGRFLVSSRLIICRSPFIVIHHHLCAHGK